MRRTLVAALAVVAVLGALPAAARPTGPVSLVTNDPTCPLPRCLELAVPVPTGLKVPDNRVRVLLPRGYDAKRKPGYPVLVLLHPAEASYKGWTTHTDVLGLTEALDVIVVMPDGGGGEATSVAGWYSDWKDGSRQWASFHMGAVVPWIDATFNSAGAGHRAIAGPSMGGFGAMSYSARYPGTFAAAAAFSGAVDTMYLAPASGPVFGAAGVSDGVWGSQVLDEATWRAHNPVDLAARLRGMTLLIASGNGVPGGAHADEDIAAGPASLFVEHSTYQLSLSLGRELDELGIAHTDLYYGPGAHTWGYWRDDLSWALPQLLARIAPANL